MQSLQLNTCYVRCFVCIVFLCISSQYCFVQNLLEIHRILCTLSENTAAKQKSMTWHELPTAVLKSSELTSSSELDCRVCWYKSVSWRYCRTFKTPWWIICCLSFIAILDTNPFITLPKVHFAPWISFLLRKCANSQWIQKRRNTGRGREGHLMFSFPEEWRICYHCQTIGSVNYITQSLVIMRAQVTVTPLTQQTHCIWNLSMRRSSTGFLWR